MASTDYSYDEQGAFFPYFVTTIVSLITLPLTYSLLTPNKDIENTAPRIETTFKPDDSGLIEGQKRKQWRRERRLKRMITVAVGWLTILAMIYLIIVTKTNAPTIWDPYDILEISRSSTEQQIKKRYRDLSRVYHPDKAAADESKNQTVEQINDYWVEVSKAFKALTDEEIRNNYVQYGHPDGKQSFSIGIALPKFIVTEGNGKYVLLVYGLLLGVLLPYIVGKWWYGTQRMTKEKVLIASANTLFREYKDGMTEAAVINALSCGDEFRQILKGVKADTGLGQIEGSIAPPDRESLKDYEGVRRKTAALLWAYLRRARLTEQSDDEKYEVAPLALKLIDSFLTIVLAYGDAPTLVSVFSASQHLIQALPPNASSLLQLPHMTTEITETIEGRYPHLTIQQFMQIPENKRRKLVTDQPSGSLTPSQYDEFIGVAKQLPFLQVEKAFFKVLGEKTITPSALVQLVVKARIIPPGSIDVPPVDQSDLEDLDPDEGDLDALLGRKSSSSAIKTSGTAKVVTDTDSIDHLAEPLLPPLAHAPYFPRDHSPRWHIFLSDSRMGKIAVPPFTMTTFDKPLKENGRPTFNVQTFKMQFQAPPNAGKYRFVFHMICDSYIGMDSKQDIVLDVEDPTEAMTMHNDVDDEISEPEEDSLAGQMNALKSGGLGGATSKKRKDRSQQQALDSESGSDTDEAGSDSDTDTDTDSETD